MNTTLILLAVLLTPVLWSLAVWKLMTRFWPGDSPQAPATGPRRASDGSLPDYQI